MTQKKDLLPHTPLMPRTYLNIAHCSGTCWFIVIWLLCSKILHGFIILCSCSSLNAAFVRRFPWCIPTTCIATIQANDTTEHCLCRNLHGTQGEMSEPNKNWRGEQRSGYTSTGDIATMFPCDDCHCEKRIRRTTAPLNKKNIFYINRQHANRLITRIIYAAFFRTVRCLFRVDGKNWTSARRRRVKSK